VRQATLLLAAGVVAAAVVACGAASEGAKLQGNFTLEQARAFDDFPVYYAGERVDDLPLVSVLRRNDTANFVSFVYGDCIPVAYDQGCAPPAEIQTWPAARRNLGSYESSAAASPTPERTTMRGRDAAFFEGGTRLEIFAGPSTVVVFSESRERVTKIASALRCVAGAASGEPEEKLEC
jgi:hypothetical protein